MYKEMENNHMVIGMIINILLCILRWLIRI